MSDHKEAPLLFEAAEILRKLRDLRPDELERIGRFLSVDRGGFGAADYRSSMLVLCLSKGWKFGAALSASKDLRDLPMIMRTGDSTPWMSGEALGLSRTRIFENLLQRIGSRHICLQAFQQDEAEFVDSLKKEFGRLSPKSGDPSDFVTHKRLIARRLLAMRPKQLENKEKQAADALYDYLDELWSRATDRKNKYIAPGKILDDEAAAVYDLLFAAALADLRKGRRHLRLDKDWAARTHVVIQGAGDLSMNRWNVALYEGELFYPEGEPILSRVYPCFLKWKDGALLIPEKKELASDFDTTEYHGERRAQERRKLEENERVSRAKKIKETVGDQRRGMLLGDELAIARLRFFPGNRATLEGGSSTEGIEEAIDFAIYGKPVLWGGRVLEPQEVVEQFEDVRHVFNLPNLKITPSLRPHGGGDPAKNDEMDSLVLYYRPLEQGDYVKQNLSEAEKFLVENYEILKRYKQGLDSFFGLPVRGDCWLLERELLRESNKNLRQYACLGPISVKLADLGAPQDWITYCLLASGYEKKERSQDIRREKQFGWDEVAGMPELHIFLARATYPCTLVGIGRFAETNSPKPYRPQDGNALFMLAWGHDFKYADCSIWDCAEALRAAGAQYALCMDEGQDVFQCFIRDNAELDGFRKAEENGQALGEWMRVPIASKEGSLSRRAMRASLAVWQQREDRYGEPPPGA